MNANPQFTAATAQVDEAAIRPLPNSRKIHVTGSCPDIRVPMREISQSDIGGRPARKQTCRFTYTARIKQEVREFATEKGMREIDALKLGTMQKATEFVVGGAEIHQPERAAIQ